MYKSNRIQTLVSITLARSFIRKHSEVPHPFRSAESTLFLFGYLEHIGIPKYRTHPVSSSLLEAYRQANLGDVVLSSLLTSFLAFRRHRPFFIMSFVNLCLSVMPPDPKLTDPLQPLSDYQSLCQRQPSVFNLPPTFLVNAPCLYLPAFIRLPMWNL